MACFRSALSCNRPLAPILGPGAFCAPLPAHLTITITRTAYPLHPASLLGYYAGWSSMPALATIVCGRLLDLAAISRYGLVL
jgi:hypothetical protein